MDCFPGRKVLWPPAVAWNSAAPLIGISPAPAHAALAFSRWKIEGIFQDGKGELELDHFEGRKYQSIRRHLILSCVNYLFLANFHQARKKNPH